MTEAPVVAATGGPRRRLATRLAAAAVLAAALAGLAVGAAAGARSVASGTDRRSVAGAELGDAYYGCLATEARTLVHPGQTVDVSVSNPANWVTLGKIVAPWTTVTFDRDRAVAVVRMVPSDGRVSCLGSVVEARYRDGTVRRATAGSLPGDEQPPSTPL
ncbi:MAG TPA: hypothetical protein VHW47_02660 [Acidimicrobiales bacterium]|nr:hypothetical protein [Acidimicrobiales bacterium]